MQIGAGGMNPFSNPYTSLTTAQASQQSEPSQGSNQIANEYHVVADSLTPSERKLYDSLMYAENYEAAKGIVAIGFLRMSGMYQDTQGNPLEGVSLREDLTRMLPPTNPSQRQSIQKLEEHLMTYPEALDMDPQKKGNLVDFKV